MSTEINAVSPEGGSAALYWFADLSDGGRVDIGVRRAADDREVAVGLPRADFLAAVATELNVFILDKADLPEVHRGPGGEGFKVGSLTRFSDSDDAATCREVAREWLALAEHLDAHPPVDEAQVEALAVLMREAMGITPETIDAGHLRPGNSDDLARVLVARGVRVDVTP